STRLLCLTLFSCRDAPTPDPYALSLHDALPISPGPPQPARAGRSAARKRRRSPRSTRRAADVPPMARAVRLQLRLPAKPSRSARDRKSTRLNSSHLGISYAVFCLKKKKKENTRK